MAGEAQRVSSSGTFEGGWRSKAPREPRVARFGQPGLCMPAAMRRTYDITAATCVLRLLAATARAAAKAVKGSAAAAGSMIYP